jgi:hypothetical protein
MSRHEPRDAAEFDEASYEIDFAALCDGDIADENYRTSSERMLRVFNKCITFLFEHGYWKSKTLWGIAYAVGHQLTMGKSMLEAARDLGCTKQAISKIACDFLAETGLPPSPALKSEEAKETYKQTNGNRRRAENANA